MEKTRRFNSFVAGLMYLGLFELLAGVALIPYYHAIGTKAYPTTLAISQSAALETVRAIHHWTSALLIVAGGLVVLYGLWIGAYKLTTKLIWITAVALPVLFVMLQLTGHIMPWTKHAVRTAVVETGIAQGIPGLGSLTATLMRGGKEVNVDTLFIWSFAHMAVFPAIFLLIGLVLMGVFKRVESSRRLALYSAGGLMLLGIILALALPLRLGAEATEADFTSFNALPEWYILPMHTLLDLFQGINPSLGFIGTAVLPGLAVFFLLLLPWIDRKPTAEGRKFRLGKAMAVVGALSLIVLSGMSAGSMAPPTGVVDTPGAAATTGGATVKADPQLIAQGQKLFASSGCTACHAVKGAGGTSAPALDKEAVANPDPAWQIKHLQNPRAVNPGSTMPKYDYLPQQSLQALAAYLTSLKG